MVAESTQRGMREKRLSNKAEKAYWDGYHEASALRSARSSHPIRLWIERFIPPAGQSGSSSCFEIGCYPGSYLSIFGELGYELNGVDFCEQVDLLAPSFRDRGFRVGNIMKQDFLKLEPRDIYDVVASFGFVEHFTNWNEILERHVDFLAPGGHLVVEAPNFIGGFQHWLHSRYDRTNYDRHHLPAMAVESWGETLSRRGLEILYTGYFGGLEFWVEEEARSKLAELFLRSLSRISRPLRPILPKNKKFYAPYGGVIAKRN